jgi:hypothetical protein
MAAPQYLIDDRRTFVVPIPAKPRIVGGAGRARTGPAVSMHHRQTIAEDVHAAQAMRNDVVTTLGGEELNALQQVDLRHQVKGVSHEGVGDLERWIRYNYLDARRCIALHQEIDAGGCPLTP